MRMARDATSGAGWGSRSEPAGSPARTATSPPAASRDNPSLLAPTESQGCSGDPSSETATWRRRSRRCTSRSPLQSGSRRWTRLRRRFPRVPGAGTCDRATGPAGERPRRQRPGEADHRGGARQESRLRAVGGRFQLLQYQTIRAGRRIHRSRLDRNPVQQGQGKDVQRHLRDLSRGHHGAAHRDAAHLDHRLRPLQPHHRHRSRHVARDPVRDPDRRLRLGRLAGTPALGRARRRGLGALGPRRLAAGRAAQRPGDQRSGRRLCVRGGDARVRPGPAQHGGLREPRLRLLGRLHPRRRLPLQLGEQEARLQPHAGGRAGRAARGPGRHLARPDRHRPSDLPLSRGHPRLLEVHARLEAGHLQRHQRRRTRGCRSRTPR